MISKRSTFFLGILIFIIPFLGLPTFWKTTFTVLSGLAIILLSIHIPVPRRNLKQRVKKEKITPVFVENIPVYPKDNTMETADVVKTRGRRKTEIK